MKKIVIAIVFTFLCLYIKFNYFHDFKTRNAYSQPAQSIQNEVFELLKSKYDIEPGGSGAATGMTGIVSMDLPLWLNTDADKNEIRKILIDSLDIYLTKINKDKVIRPYLVEYPFPTSRIHVSLDLKTKNGKGRYFPEINYAFITHNKIFYMSQKDLYADTIKETETLEEARKLIHEK